ncbi:hypothetical protein [Acinetobacter beijerinckii]|uniref:Uncharacterized protein n=1 Tax=Acinetobacter beijerinckii CIP 110307 TaxID=1217648 RepID=N9FSU8_9GAMM|nr:hypothetical protein [Acinetobacter beijerinckii]ENW08001.1 hypothetical protein F933_00527 [Acinetobacter beijerinckii CIP 110307]
MNYPTIATIPFAHPMGNLSSYMSSGKLQPILFPNPPNDFSWGNPEVGQYFLHITQSMKDIERDKLKPFIKDNFGFPAPNNRFMWLVSQQSYCPTIISHASNMVFNPHLTVFFQQAELANQINVNFSSVPEYLAYKYNEFQGALLLSQAGLKAKNEKKVVNQQITEQKKYFNKILSLHGQSNGIFLEIPCLFDYGAKPLKPLTLDEQEKKFVEVARQFLRDLKGGWSFKQKSCYLFWRTVKGFDGMGILQIMFYVVGEAADYHVEINEIWELTCLSKKFHLQKNQMRIRSSHCYDGNGIVGNEWKQLIERYQIPLEFYRYESNGFDWKWQPY